MLVDKIADKWRCLLEDNEDTTYQGEWVGFYVDGEDDPALVLRCEVEYAPTCMQLHHLVMPLPVQCFTVGTHSRCLREWEKPEGELVGFFHEAKIIQTHRGPKREGDKEQLTFFYGKIATLGWDPNRWHWSDEGRFLDYTTKDSMETINKRNPGATRAADKWQGYLPGNYKFYWSEVWDPLCAGKEAAFIW